MDWHGKVITLVGKEDGHIYDCTIGVIESVTGLFTNVICVDMRNILTRFASNKKRAGHAMVTAKDCLERY